MTFAGVKDFGMLYVGADSVKYVVGMDIAIMGVPLAGVPRYVFAIDHRAGMVLYGSGMVRRSFWQRLRSAWRVLRGGLP